MHCSLFCLLIGIRANNSKVICISQSRKDDEQTVTGNRFAAILRKMFALRCGSILATEFVQMGTNMIPIIKKVGDIESSATTKNMVFAATFTFIVWSRSVQTIRQDPIYPLRVELSRTPHDLHSVPFQSDPEESSKNRCKHTGPTRPKTYGNQHTELILITRNHKVRGNISRFV